MSTDNDLSRVIKSSIAHQTLPQEGYEIHYNVSGEKNEKTVIFLHAAFSDHTIFNEQIDFFSKEYKVVTIDLIGHGLSKPHQSKDKIDASPDHILKIMEIEHIDKAHFAGVSMGSLIAQYCALKHPKRVQSLVILGGYDINERNKEVTRAQRGANASLILSALFSMTSFRKKAAKITCHSPRGQALFYQSSLGYTRKSFRVMSGLQHVIKDRENADPVCPMLILVGQFDIDLAKKLAKDWHSNTPGSQYFQFPEAGHCANLDEPTLFNQTVKTFFESLH